MRDAMRIACTGFVSENGGSIAAANAVLLRELLRSGHKVDFFSKPSFVDPRPSVGDSDLFRFRIVTNRWSDALRRRVARIPVISFSAGRLDSNFYNRTLVRAISRAHRSEPYDLCLWLGDYARGSVDGIPTISFVQGPPGTDARSIIERGVEIRVLAGFATWMKWRILATMRLSRWGLPPFQFSDHLIVGSRWSASSLERWFSVPREKISTLAYPIDLTTFRPRGESCVGVETAILRVLWLGRIVPRKRLDLFLKGAELAIRSGIDLHLTIVGQSGFIKGYEKLVERFPFPDRLVSRDSLPRTAVPGLIHQHDVLVQPSDHEDFGSSVAEAQACGLPVIVGATNGNSDYLCERDIHLEDDSPENLSLAFKRLIARKGTKEWGDAQTSRIHAERHFAPRRACENLCAIIDDVVKQRKHGGAMP